MTSSGPARSDHEAPSPHGPDEAGSPPPMRLEQVRQLADDLMTRMNSVIEGKPQGV